MNQSRTIKVNEDQQHTLFTYGLCGCTSTLILSQHFDKSSTATLTHYDPLRNDINRTVIMGELTRERETKHSVIVLTPSDWVKVEEKWIMQPKDKELTASIIDSVKKIIGSEIKVRIILH